MKPGAPSGIAGHAWTQRVHTWLGLYFLAFLWLFAASGLLLNHGWRFAEFWPQRQESSRERLVTPPVGATDLLRAQDLMRQLGLVGEIEWTAARPDPGRFDFRVRRPGYTVDVRVDGERRVAVLREIRVNGWGVFRALHTFSGTRAGDPAAVRDWWLTKLWSLAMDALAAGLGLLVVTGLVLGLSRPEQRRGGALALGLGVAVCGFFVFVLRWL